MERVSPHFEFSTTSVHSHCGPFIRVMNTKPTPRSAFIFAAAALLLAGLPLPASAAKFPPLNSPATTEHRPGKLVWADLFTTDPEGATKFYCGLLGWTAKPLSRWGKGYTVFSNGGTPVAGLSPRSMQGPNHPSRWIGYYAVIDIDGTVAALSKAGGTVRAPSKNFPDRGYQAIVSGPDGIPIGLLQSSTGDAPDSEPDKGAWNWFELYVKSPAATSAFYHDTLGFDVAPETNSEKKSEFVLSSAGQARGGIAMQPDGDDVKPSWLGVIRVADLDKTLALVPGLGGEVLVAPHSVEFGSRFAIILDSTGGTVGLVQYMDSANPANSQ
jgi:predicted enzyme related to lactoylglutathione lyase